MRPLGHGKYILVCGVDSPIANIMLNRIVEKRGILWHDTNAPAKGLEGNIADVLIIDKDSAALNIVGAEEKPQNGGFPERD